MDQRRSCAGPSELRPVTGLVRGRTPPLDDAFDPAHPAGRLGRTGGMAERPNARLLKSLGMRVPGGSNPSPSAGYG